MIATLWGSHLTAECWKSDTGMPFATVYSFVMSTATKVNGPKWGMWLSWGTSSNVCRARLFTFSLQRGSFYSKMVIMGTCHGDRWQVV